MVVDAAGRAVVRFLYMGQLSELTLGRVVTALRGATTRGSASEAEPQWVTFRLDSFLHNVANPVTKMGVGGSPTEGGGAARRQSAGDSTADGVCEPEKMSRVWHRSDGATG